MKLTLSLLTLLICFNTLIYSQKIRYEKNSDLAHKLAKSEEKLLCYYFFDSNFRASKIMKDKVLLDEELVAFQNENFINLLITNDNKYFEEITYNYYINSFPTFLYTNYKGNEVHRTSGSMPPEELIRNGLLAREGPKNVEKHYKSLYKKNKKNPDFLLEYVNFNLDVGNFRKTNGLLKDYLKLEDQIDSTEWMSVCLNYSLDHNSPCFKKVDKYRSDFIDRFGENRVNEAILNGALSKTYDKYNPYWEFEDFERNLLRNVDKLDMKNYDVLLTKTLTTTLFSGELEVEKDDITKYGLAFLKCCTEKKNLELNYTAAGHILINSDIEAQLKLVEKSMEKAFDLNEDIKAVDLLSVAQYKLDKTEEAMKSVAEAKRLSEMYQVSYISTLERMKALSLID